jgi:hypothetical protein
MYLYQRMDGDGRAISRGDGKVWLMDRPPADGGTGAVLLEVDLNVPERALDAYEQSKNPSFRAFLVPSRWIARHATVHSA